MHSWNSVTHSLLVAHVEQEYYVPSSALVAGRLEPIKYNSTLGIAKDPDYLDEHGQAEYGVSHYEVIFTLIQKGLEVLDLTQCRQAFDREFVTGYRGLIVVVNATDFPALYSIMDKYTSEGLAYPEIRQSLHGAPISHCLAWRVKEICKFCSNAPLAWTVIAFDAMKVIVLVLTCYNARGISDPLMTTGDAIASFVDEPDSTTTSLCLMQKSTLSWWKDDQRCPRAFAQGRARRWISVGRTRWATWLTL